jgi:glycolate oxidase
MEGMSGTDVLAELIDGLPAGIVVTDPDVVASYRQDWARDPDAGVPAAVVRAGCTADVAAAVRWAAAHRVPVVPRGAGSGLSGGSSAVEGGIVLSLERMRAITVDVPTRTVVAQPGALNGEVKAAAARHGLWYPPDPSSFEMCSIGGNVATNAGGLCCVKYGVTTDYVLGLEVVLADGTPVRMGGPRLKDVAGLSLMKLFVGSEGTLGVVTEVTLRLLPARPPASTLVATFSTVDAAAAAVVAITASLRPSMLELMDATSINAVEDMLSMGLDRSAGALLLAQSDAAGSAAAEEIELMHRAVTAAGAMEAFSTTDPAEGDAFCVARRSAFLALEKKGDLFLEDVGVPIPVLPALLRGLVDVGRRNDVIVATVAHAGDGNTHPLIVYDAADPDATNRARIAFAQIMELATELGGTITGEHGVGRLKKAWLPAYLGADLLALNKRVKQALDPAGILNPGAVF